jgi:hypothetical protein
MLTTGNQLTLSVICPVTKMHGRLDNLMKWIDEIRNLNVEAFIVHDIQDEKTGPELSKLLQGSGNPRVHLSQGFFGEAGSARNSVLKLCQGNWIAFWDSDDCPRVLDVMSEIDSKFDIIIGEYEVSHKGILEDTFRHYGKSFQENIDLVSFNPGLWRCVFRRELLKEITFPKIKMGEDQDFLAQINWTQIKVKFANKSFYKYNVGDENQTTAVKNSRAPILKSLKFLKSLLENGKGDARFIHNLITRQVMTLIKTLDVFLLLKALVILLSILVRPRYLFPQSIAFIRLLKFFRNSTV